MSPTFRLEVSFSEHSGDPVAAYLRVRSGPVAETREVCDGVAFADYSEDGTLIGVELLGPCEVSVLEGLSREEPVPIQTLLRQGFCKSLVRT